MKSSHIYFFCCILGLTSWVHGGTLGKRTTEDVQGDIDQAMSKVKGDSPNAQSLKSKLRNLKTEVNTKWNTEDNREKLVNVVSTITDSIGKLQSDDPIDIATGCLDLLAGLAENLGPLSAIAPLFSILSMVIGLFGGEQVQESVGDVVKKALREQRDEELEAEAFATQREFTVSKAFLDGIRKEPKDLTEMEVASLSANVPIYKGVKFLAILVQRIKKAEPKNVEEAKKILSFMELLTDLCSIRDIILLDLYQLVSSAGHSPNIAAGILEVKNVGRGEFKQALQELFKGDNPKHWILYASLYPKDRSPQTKKIHKFFKSIELQDIPRLDVDLSGNRIISALAYPDYCMASPDTDSMQGNYAKASYRRQCTVRLNKEGDGFYSMRVYQGRTAYATEDYVKSGKGRSIDKLAKFNFIPVKVQNNEFYIVSCLEWSDRFVYEMANEKGWIAFYQGNPSTSGYQEKAYWKVQRP